MKTRNWKLEFIGDRTIVFLNMDVKKVKEKINCPKINPHKVRCKLSIASELDVCNEQKRLKDIENQYQEITKYNKKVMRYNHAVATSRNHDEFMNSAKHLKN
jgi:hypothetical protein